MPAQVPFDATVRISLDTNLTMIKENPDDGPSCTVAGRCGLLETCAFAQKHVCKHLMLCGAACADKKSRN